ncbi:MAG: hypothetical protein GY810_06740 [Aureispira sp.]|nr:hypothetical protein [Aureispira sp.]
MNDTKEKIIALLTTGEPVNIELALQLYRTINPKYNSRLWNRAYVLFGLYRKNDFKLSKHEKIADIFKLKELKIDFRKEADKQFDRLEKCTPIFELLENIEAVFLNNYDYPFLPSKLSSFSSLAKVRMGLPRNYTTINLDKPAKVGANIKIKHLGFVSFNSRKPNLVDDYLNRLFRNIGKSCKTLVELDFSETYLSEIPENLAEIKTLQSLNLSRNERVSKSSFNNLQNLTSLQSLNLSFCKIKDDLSYLKPLKNLKSLDISCNDLTIVPEFLGKLKGLEVLKIASNPLVRIPDFIGNSTLEELNLNHLLSSMQHDFLLPKTLKRISLCACRFQDIPEVVWGCSNLEELNLSGNPIYGIPDKIGSLTKLKKISVSGARLTIETISLKIENCKNLEELDLSRNRYLEAIPEVVFIFKKLRVLNLASTKIKTIPEEIGGLTKLESLDLSENITGELPRSLQYLVNLKYLAVYNIYHGLVGGNQTFVNWLKTKLPDTKIEDHRYMPGYML